MLSYGLHRSFFSTTKLFTLLEMIGDQTQYIHKAFVRMINMHVQKVLTAVFQDMTEQVKSHRNPPTPLHFTLIENAL